MKKTTYCMFTNKQTSEKANNCPNKNLQDDGIHPPLFCEHTWTKSVPICVIYLYVEF